VYSSAAITAAYGEFARALQGRDARVCYSVKANSNLAVLALLARLGSGFDIVSGGELERVLAAGGEAAKALFSGVGKSVAEIELALGRGIGCINVESEPELERVAAAAERLGRRAPIALRVNPDIDAQSHPNISTGLKTNKFGVALQDARSIYQARRDAASLQFVGVHIHIGSQITTLDPLRRAAETLVSLALELRDDGFALEHVDLGGGLGIAYEGRPIIDPVDYAAAVIPELRRIDLPVVLEPGRAVVGHSGALIARVVDTKCFPDGRKFAVLDAGMGELIRPALYGSFHRIVPVVSRRGTETAWDVVGPICESSDVFARDRQLPPLEVDDLIAILDAGAYGSVMASNYNRHMLAAEVLVDEGKCAIIRRRQTLEDVLALES
jgi:diaminopimelate decarboxylase